MSKDAPDVIGYYSPEKPVCSQRHEKATESGDFGSLFESVVFLYEIVFSKSF